MSDLISYAQNFEDVMLWRALRHVQDGVYIDIGAQDPIIDSVSLAFYEHGWSGIHVEPTAHYAELLRQHRPRDTVIQAAVSNESSLLQFFEIPNTGISTAVPNIIEQHIQRGFHANEITVPCITLSSIFQKCENSEIHWLKIDVEGLERQVILSWGESKTRPWIVVVESTLPLTQIESHDTWESILVGYGYTYVYFDGLNRFYISITHPELAAAFLSPPNVFDGFSLNGTASATFHHLISSRNQEKIDEINTQNEQQQKNLLDQIENINQTLKSLNEQHDSQLLALQNKSSENEHQLNLKINAEQEKLRVFQQNQLKHEQLIAEKTSSTQLKIENLLKTQAEREKEFANKTVETQQQFQKEKAELLISHNQKIDEINTQNEQQQKNLLDQIENINQTHKSLNEQYDSQILALQNKSNDNEHQLNLKIAAEQEKLRVFQQNQIKHEQLIAEKANNTQLKIENLLKTQAEREKEFANKTLEAQQQFQKEKADLFTIHKRQIEDLSLIKNELELTLKTMEQAVSTQLLKSQEIQKQHTIREIELNNHLQQLQNDFHLKSISWAKAELELNKEIANHRSEIQILNSNIKVLDKNIEHTLTTNEIERKNLIATHNAIKNELTEKVLSEQTKSLQLKKLLLETQQNIDKIHKSLSWRVTNPLRTLSELLKFKSPENVNLIVSETIESKSIDYQTIPSEPIMHNSTQNTSLPQANQTNSLDELLSYFDKKFVACAYQTVLGRNADPDGFTYYLNRIQTGHAKIQILGQLRFSSEGRTYASKLSGLDRAALQYKKGQLPIVGWIFRLLSGCEGNSHIERKLRMLQNQLFLLGQESETTLSRLEKNIESLQILVKSDSSINKVSTSEYLSATELTSPSTSDLSQSDKLNTQTMEIFNHLKLAINNKTID